MFSDNKSLGLFVRKNYGKHKLAEYKLFFKNLNIKNLEYIDLEQSDEVRENIRAVFPTIKRECEMIESHSSLKDSKLLHQIFRFSNENDSCYIFIDDVEECGMFKANTISALENCLIAAKLAFENTFFLTDCEFKFSFTLNYYDEKESYDKNKFDIQRQVAREIIKDDTNR